MQYNEIEKKVWSLLEEVAPYEEISSETNFLKESILDSLGILTLVGMLDEEFDFEIDQEKITATNFETVASICELVQDCLKIKED